MALKAAEREGKRHPLSLRVTAAVRRQLEATASASGRSLTQEAEFRLEQSFLRNSFHEQSMILADVIGLTMTSSAKLLSNDPLATLKERRYTFKRVLLALRRLSFGLGVQDIESIESHVSRDEATAIEAMAIRDDSEEQAARDRWSHAFGAWAQATKNTAASPKEALEDLQRRMLSTIDTDDLN